MPSFAEHREFQLEAGHLLRSLTSVRNSFWKKQSEFRIYVVPRKWDLLGNQSELLPIYELILDDC